VKRNPPFRKRGRGFPARSLLEPFAIVKCDEAPKPMVSPRWSGLIRCRQVEAAGVEGMLCARRRIKRKRLRRL